MSDLLEKDIGKLIIVTKKEGDKEIVHKGYLVSITNHLSGFNLSATLKLKQSGYNIDINLENTKIENTKIEITNEKVELGKPPTHKLKNNSKLPNITYIGTGGTIGTHVDYNTGGVHMCRTPEEIISTTPELENIVNIKKIESPIIKASEDLYPKDWEMISKTVYNSLEDKDIDGIIITHGTDTLSYTGTAISFMIENVNKPVLLVGAQRSPDRASFDGFMNLICAAQFIKDKVPGVYLVMHGSINDDFCYVIRANKSRKMHTSRRDAFKAINEVPVAKVYKNGKIEYLVNKPIITKKPKLNNTFENKVALIKVYPGSDPSIIDWYIDNKYKGLVLEGTGLGHIPTGLGGISKDLPEDKQWLPFVKKAVDKGIIVIMSSQCLFGRVNSKVYANLIYTENVGVEYLDNHDMLPEVTYIKLGVALSRFKTKKEVINYMKTSVAGEITEKETPNAYDKAIE